MGTKVRQGVMAVLVAAVAVACGTHHSAVKAGPSSASTHTAATVSRGNPGMIRAAAAWHAGASAPSYRQGDYFMQAARDLAAGLRTDVVASTRTGSTTYSRAIGSLRWLAAQPDTGVTPAERSKIQQALVALNRFFRTSGLYF